MDDNSRSSLSIFSRKLDEIPCFKSSFMIGITSGLVTGLARFMFSSRVKHSANIGVYTFTAVTFGYWCYCRYCWSRDRFMYKRIERFMTAKVLDEGQEYEPPKLDGA